VKIKVKDENGRSGSAWIPVGLLEPGQTAPFKKAWMGRLESYEVAEAR
jgi:hypothetical protein